MVMEINTSSDDQYLSYSLDTDTMNTRMRNANKQAKTSLIPAFDKRLEGFEIYGEARIIGERIINIIICGIKILMQKIESSGKHNKSGYWWSMRCWRKGSRISRRGTAKTPEPYPRATEELRDDINTKLFCVV